MKTAACKIGLISPCGWGNLGDAAILDAVIHHIRARLPEVDFCAFTMNPEDTMVRHRISSFRITELSLRHYHCVTVSKKEQAEPSVRTSESAPMKPWVAQLKKIPWVYPQISRAYWRMSSDDFFLKQVRNELRCIPDWVQALKSFDCLIVAGGGQLDEFWGGPWGHPYALFRWAAIAALTGTTFVVLSVGTSSLASSLSRTFVRGALSLAGYRSFRDNISKERVNYIKKTGSDPIVPDLAYSLPVVRFQRAESANPHPVVGVSPIAYCDPRVWPVSDRPKYLKYLEELGLFVIWLLNEGHEVMFFASDGPDLKVVEDLRAVIASKGDTFLQRVCGPPDLTVDALLHELVKVDYVVTSRLHGVILSHILNLPVLAISYDNKVDSHMKNVNQIGHCLNINEIRCNEIIDGFNDLKRTSGEVRRVLGEHVSEFRTKLNNQYDTITSMIGSKHE